MREKIQNHHTSILLALTIVAIMILLFSPRISQDPHYHNFSDTTPYFNIPNGLNVLSNIPFLIIGVLGFIKIKNCKLNEFPKGALSLFFVGVVLTGIGSAYYHWNPTNQTLLWDRLPMTITFMALLSAIISLHMEYWSGKLLLTPLILLGISSCLYWYYSELNGQGDLRPYIFVQFYPMLIIPFILFLFPLTGVSIKIFVPMFGFYILAKYFEYYDEEIYTYQYYISGHSLKHLFAAMATLTVLNIEKIYLPHFNQ